MVWKKVILGDIWGCLGRNFKASSQVKETLDLGLKAASRTLAFAVRDQVVICGIRWAKIIRK